MKLFRKIYKITHKKSLKHNQHLWPYTKITRCSNNIISSIKVYGAKIPLVNFNDILNHNIPAIHIVLSGPSIRNINYSKLKNITYMGVNGSIALKDKFDIEFPYYCIIDSSFARNQQDTIKKIIVEKNRILFLTPYVLRYMLKYTKPNNIKCKLCLIEHINFKAFEPEPNAYELSHIASQNHKIKIYDSNTPIGFSMDYTAGWFDADTVAYAALQVSTWLGFKKIYFHGLDMKPNKNQQRFYEENKSGPETRLEQNFSYIIEPSFKFAAETLKQKGIEIFNLSDNSALSTEIIPYKNWLEL